MKKTATILTITLGLVMAGTIFNPVFAKPSGYQPVAQAEVHVKKGQKFSLNGNYDAAMKEYQEAINLDPNYALPYNNIGYIYRQKGNVDKAIEYYEKALELNPNDDTAHTNLASAYDSKGMYDKAIEEMHKALDIDPGSITVELALEKIMQKKAAEECKTFEQVKAEVAALYPRKQQEPCYNKYLDLLNEVEAQETGDIELQDKYESFTDEMNRIKTEIVEPSEQAQTAESVPTEYEVEAQPLPTIDIKKYIEEELEVKTPAQAVESDDATMEDSQNPEQENKVYEILSDPSVGALMVLYQD